DVVWVSTQRLATVLWPDGKLHAAPDLIVEVLSPGAANERRDREVKLTLYSRRGVHHLASQRSRETLKPRGGLLGNLQPPYPTVRLEIVALAFHQPALDPSVHDVQLHAEALGRSRHGVALIRITVWK
ncbi:MAG: Uma2 family endonuclease, partial [Candidatus Rokubacteria bacterium]|nr:Uma2 family endonuclease [Candidatus Rokubacteria bacterium]